MGASPQTPGVFRIVPMGLNATIRAALGKEPTSAARRRDAPLAKSAAPVALQQSRILRTTAHGCMRHAHETSPHDLTFKIALAIFTNIPQTVPASVTDVVGQFVTDVPVRTANKWGQ